MRWLRSWRLPLRLARRDATRARGRSILVLVMIALPVLGVVAADVVIQTADVNSQESLDRRLGAAEARVTVQDGVARVFQGADPDGPMATGGGQHGKPPTLADLETVLGGASVTEVRHGDLDVRTEKGVGSADATELDLDSPITDGLFDLTSGRWPAAADEVVVNQAVVDKGYAVGDVLDIEDDAVPDPTIVAVAESTTAKDRPVVAGPLGSLGVQSAGTRTWLVGGDPVTWSTVRDLNRLGASVLSRAVVLDPPSEAELPSRVRGFDTGPDEATVAVAVLVVVMTLLEVVLLAGPAFAVGARRQSRALALMAAAGGTPKQSRRVVLAGAVVLGGVASVLGVVLGIGLAWVLAPVVQRWNGTWFGPLEVPWLHVVGVAAFGLLSALLAAVVPAWIASRQDVVAVLAGRRGDRRPSLRSPLLGLVLLGLGIAGAVVGARASNGGEIAIAGSAVLTILGTILLIPLLLVGLARLAAPLPLTLRYAVRDAARHRSRTVPAVAAVAATVAGVVALGIGVTSDEAENRETYTPSLPYGAGSVTAEYGSDLSSWDALREAVLTEAPDATVTPVRGVVKGDGMERTSYFLQLQVPAAGEGAPLLDNYGSSLGSSTLVSDDGLPAGLTYVPESAHGPAAAMLRKGGVVAFTTRGVEAAEIRAIAHRYDPETNDDSTTRATLPALIVPVEDSQAGPQAVLSTAAAEELGLPVGTVGLVVDGTDITERQETDVQEALAAIDENTSFHVERGYQADNETDIIQLVLAALGAVLMLGGTLTATFLALSDARPDLATLSAVGAAPRTRRGVAAAYALVIGLVGALLGAAIGFVPGIAVTYPLTAGYDQVAAAHYLDIPWLLILGLVVALPLLTALIVGLTARSRLPLVVRLE